MEFKIVGRFVTWKEMLRAADETAPRTVDRRGRVVAAACMPIGIDDNPLLMFVVADAAATNDRIGVPIPLGGGNVEPIGLFTWGLLIELETGEFRALEACQVHVEPMTEAA